eukprot:TRINITY_DN8866_c0_g1_i1.p1 TRINITY_DN8866_c0_g1~~TRINITY_DN8866_c0_g1_i1.p1  ORF type:complete len:101 (-),score=18.66 TRINITY_DN8866_c0_g1_i1:63-365(-)
MEYCKANQIYLQAYASLGQGNLLKEEMFEQKAQELGVTPSQFLLRWAVQQDIGVIPRSSKPDRILENSQLFHFDISTNVMQHIKQMDKNIHYAWDPSDIR